MHRAGLKPCVIRGHLGNPRSAANGIKKKIPTNTWEDKAETWEEQSQAQLRKAGHLHAVPG